MFKLEKKGFIKELNNKAGVVIKVKSLPFKRVSIKLKNKELRNENIFKQDTIDLTKFELYDNSENESANQDNQNKDLIKAETQWIIAINREIVCNISSRVFYISIYLINILYSFWNYKKLNLWNTVNNPLGEIAFVNKIETTIYIFDVDAYYTFSNNINDIFEICSKIERHS